MLQKTITVNGKRYTPQMIDRIMQSASQTVCDDYIIDLGDGQRYAMYRERQDDYFSPKCSRGRATHIALTEPYGYTFTIWLPL